MQVLFFRRANHRILSQQRQTKRAFAKINRILFSHPEEQAPVPAKADKAPPVVNIATRTRSVDLSPLSSPPPQKPRPTVSELKQQYFDLKMLSEKTGLDEKALLPYYERCSGVEEALNMVREANALKLATQTGYDIGDCRELLGHYMDNYNDTKAAIEKMETHPYNHLETMDQKSAIWKHMKSWKEVFYGGG